MITQVTVICDNPAHDGKVATVAVYRKFAEGWEREHSFRRQPKRRAAGQDKRRQNAFAKAAKSGDPNQIAAALSGDPRGGRPACKLCGLEFLPEWAVRLSFFAAQGMSRISIWQLRRVR